MAATRVIISMDCCVCKRGIYSTTKYKRTLQEKLQLKKYCPWCGKHTAHKEGK